MQPTKACGVKAGYQHPPRISKTPNSNGPNSNPRHRRSPRNEAVQVIRKSKVHAPGPTDSGRLEL